MNKKIIYSLIILLLFAACYKDGPYISFRGKHARLTGIWYFNEVNVDGIDSTSAYQQRFLEIDIVSNHDVWAMYTEDAKMEFYYDDIHAIEAFGSFSKFSTHLSVHMGGGGPLFSLCPIGDAGEQDWKILKLSNLQFWFNTNFNNKKYIFKLKNKYS